MENTKTIRHDCTDKPVCPNCGSIIQDVWDYDFRDGKVEIWCPDCEKEMTVYENVIVTYTSYDGHEE